MTYDQISELAETIEKPPYHIAPEQVWKAYEQLEKSKVRGRKPAQIAHGYYFPRAFYNW